jgi:hypothetical protein
MKKALIVVGFVLFSWLVVVCIVYARIQIYLRLFG